MNTKVQHYSALLRDEVAGVAVNLLDAEKPNDIYAKVAEKLEEKLNGLGRVYLQASRDQSNTSSTINSGMLCSDNFDRSMAQAWLDLGINRKLTKRPVMVLPYGGTKLSCREYIEEYMLDNYHPNFLFEHFNYIGKDPHTTIFRASRWLSNYLWEAIGDTLKSAIVGMSYIRQKLKGHKEKPIEWTTPCGLLVHQAYENTTRHRIKTELYGTISKYWVLLPDDSGLLSKQKQTNGICPNFIHSLDASCLMKYINKAKAQGIESFGAVHDSYGTLACHTATTQKLLREAFVEVYSNPKDVLETFIEAVTGETPDDLPEKGNLDINDVLISQYFFN